MTPLRISPAREDQQPRPPGRRGELPGPLRGFLWIVIGLWAASLLYSELLWLVRHSWYGFDQIFLATPAFDFYDYLPRMDYLHDPDFFTTGGYAWYYPAPAALVYCLFYAVGNVWDSWVPGYLVYAAVAVGGLLFGAWRLGLAIERRGIRRRSALSFVLIAAVFSWPFYFALERGNIEAVTWLLLAGGVWAIARERWMLAAVLLGVAASVKIYPGLMFAVFLRPRRWKEIGIGVLTAVALTLASLRFLEPDVLVAWHGVADGVRAWTRDYAGIFDPVYLAYDHSAFEFLKAVLPGHHAPYDVLLGRYMAVAAGLSLLLFFGCVMRLPRINQVLFVTVASVLLPPASFDYTLVNLYVPFAWIAVLTIDEQNRGAEMRAIATPMVLFGLLLGPETFLTRGEFAGAALFKCLCLLALLVTAVAKPLGRPEPGRDRWPEQAVGVAG